MVKCYGIMGWDYTVSFLGQVIAIVISRPRSLTIKKLFDLISPWLFLIFKNIVPFLGHWIYQLTVSNRGGVHCGSDDNTLVRLLLYTDTKMLWVLRIILSISLHGNCYDERTDTVSPWHHYNILSLCILQRYLWNEDTLRRMRWQLLYSCPPKSNTKNIDFRF